MNTSLVPDGTPVAFTGYPKESAIPMTFRTFVMSYKDFSASNKPIHLYLQGHSLDGFSGSPIYTENGQVVGVLKGSSIGEDTGIIVAAPIKSAVRILRKLKRSDIN